MSDNEKPRITMREQAFEIASKAAGHERPTAAHLEEAILLLKAEAAGSTETKDSLTIEGLKSETDQLYRELTVEIRTQSAQMAERLDKIEGHMEALAKSIDAIRIMLNIFGEELGEADTSALFKEANELMTNVLEPLARERKAPVIEQAKSEDDTRGSQREETEEIQQKEDADLEMNGHAVLQEDKAKDPHRAHDNGRD